MVAQPAKSLTQSKVVKVNSFLTKLYKLITKGRFRAAFVVFGGASLTTKAFQSSSFSKGELEGGEMLSLIENQCRQLEREAPPPLLKGKGAKAHLAWLLTPTKKTPAEKSAGVLCVTYLSMFILLA